jgi:protein-disulfide isomerase
VSNRRKRDERLSRGAAMRRERERAGARRNRTVAAIVAAIVAVIVAAGALVFAVQRGGSSETPHEMTSDYGIVYSADSIGSDEKVEGIKPVKLVFYEDFICPACKAFEDQVGSYVEDQVKLGVISVEYRPIAFLDQASTTDYSSRAANAAACVYDSGGVEAFQKFHDILFANQPPEGGPGLDDDTLIQMADQAGADDVESCIDSQEFEDVVIDATDAASQNNVVETPTILVAGEELESSQEGTVPGLEDLVNAVLAAGARTPVAPSEPSASEPGATESPADKQQ